ncbi:beta-1,3-glucanase [Paraburkholderia caballeronis]|uniref:beta-1,3-glucanase family protein n=1 Tax=Paraburkholderia caballeronis TaxID=416943 RepID=UPI001066942A|nr:beta-1,3-glucanase family protein [Paraburkholderia caballeronis]TDV37981.1 beta-1,3-glucanase [Paraburkholderia caballeronis]
MVSVRQGARPRLRNGAAALAAVSMLSAAALLAACGGGGGDSGTPAASSGNSAGNGNPAGGAPGAPNAPPASGLATTPGGPAISIEPAPQTVSAGQQAFFMVKADGATSYQWYRNGHAISGATSSNYFAPAAQSGDDGAVFAVAVSNGIGTTASTNATLSFNTAADASPPASFWGSTASLPPATQVMTFAFLNRTNGKVPDSQIFWQIQGRSASGQQINEFHSIADAPTFDSPGINSARMYFYIAPTIANATQTPTSYYDFIEFNLGRGDATQPWNFNGDTTRVDAFGLKLAIRLQCTDGTDVVRGEDYGTFLEDRSVTFAKYLATVPAEFQTTGTQNAPYRIVEPGGAANFQPGGANAAYYDSYVDTVWAANGIDPAIVPKPTAFLRFADGSRPDLIAAIERHVADQPGTFKSDGTLVNPNFWSTLPQSAFYPAGPANYYAKFWHTHGIDALAYGFSYDDVGAHSSDIGCNSPQRLVVAVGW